VFGRTQAGEAAIAAARALLEASGAKAAVERRIEQAIAEGEAALEGAPIEQEGRARLLALGRMIAARSA
jgi:geranylgeranyl pyrophosphate synthase